MREEHRLNGPDHRAVIIHLDMESFLGMGPPRAPHDNVKIRTRAVTSARVKGKLSDTAEAYTKELDAMLGKNSSANTSRNDNTIGKRVRDATAAYRDAKSSGVDLALATNTLLDDMDKLLVDAANRPTWDQRQTTSRKAGWSLPMARHTAALKFLQKSKNWQIPWLRTQLSDLPLEQKNELSSP